MLCDRKGSLLIDFVGKLENLEKDWCFVCEHIDIPQQTLPRENLTARKPYQAYYDAASKERVARYWAREIELFEYAFDDKG